MKDKELPPLPLGRRAANKQKAKMYSSETYAQLLEQENKQLRMHNNQLQGQVRNLEKSIAAESKHKRASLEQISGLEKELQRRDKAVGEIARIIIEEFDKYKQVVSYAGAYEDITVFSCFDD